MLWIILFAVCAALELVFVPLFLKFSWPEKCVKSLAVKMVCSTLFILCGVFAMKGANNNSEYAKLILWGLGMGWLGDLFLHIPSKKNYFFGVGMAAFIAGHIFYIIAFQNGIQIYYPNTFAIAWYEVLAVLAVVGLIALYSWKKKISAKPYMIAAFALYAIVIIFMLVKAVHLCVSFWAYGLYEHMVSLCLTVAFGALLFVLSDGSLGLIIAGGQGGKKPIKWFNIGTYYAAQVLLAGSIFLVYSVSY